MLSFSGLIICPSKPNLKYLNARAYQYVVLYGISQIARLTSQMHRSGKQQQNLDVIIGKQRSALYTLGFRNDF